MSPKNWKIATLILGVITLFIVFYAIYGLIFNKKNLNIKAAIVYNIGGAQPVAKIPFLLLDADVKTISKEANIPTDTPFDMSVALEPKIIAATKRHIVSTATTDFQGNATFENIPSGKYTIHSIAQTRGGFVVWYSPVSLESNNQTVFLDQNNAIYAQ